MRKLLLILPLLFVAAPALAADAVPVVAADHSEAAGSAAGSAATTLSPEASDLGLLAKLWKSGAFISLGCIALYVGLTVWSKLDKKRAWYAATSAGALVLIIEGIRKGDTPSIAALVTVLGPLAGVLIKGPSQA